MTEGEIKSCEDALRMLAEYLDGELEPRTRAEMERHLDVCRSCYSRAEFEERLKAMLADSRADVGRGLRDRVQTMIRTFTVASNPD